MLMKKLSLSVAATMFFAGSLFAADTYKIDKSHSDATFQIRHLVSKVSGRFGEFGGTITGDLARPQTAKVEFTIKAASINTDEPKRDEHLRGEDFFDVAKFPQITFRSTSIAPAGKNRFNVTGDFTMHGVTKRITLPVEYLGATKDAWGNEKHGFSVEAELSRKDYGIIWNKALDQGGYVLGENVKCSINLQATKEKPAAK